MKVPGYHEPAAIVSVTTLIDMVRKRLKSDTRRHAKIHLPDGTEHDFFLDED